LFEEGIKRAGQLESTCDECADVTEGSPVPGELDPAFPQLHTNSNGLGARAGPDEFRTTPLWGVGQRIFFLHDGRTSDLLEAIRAHFSFPSPPDPRHHDPAYPASEANGVIRNFNELSSSDKQAILDFLRSL
jgi:CxxC motif-containing protein (DUF1111 family)